MSDSIDIQLNDNFVAGEPLTPRAVNNEPHAVFGDSLFTPPHDHQVGIFQPTPNGTKFWVPKVINKPVEGEPLTPRAVNNEPHVVFGDSLFTPPHDHQVGIFQPTPNGTKFWVPKVINKPVEGTVFDTLELALNAYKAYARESGFEVRKGGQKYSKKSKDEPNNKYFYCVRQGVKPPPKNGNKKSDKSQTTNPLGVNKVIKRRKRASCHCGCDAQLRLKKLPDGTYSVSKFIEKHNHSLVYEDDIKYLRASRRLTFSKQQLLNQMSNVNIGPVRSWKVLKEMYGGFEYIGATDVDCKNYRRGLTEFIGERDAQMRNYAAFGDVVSFDATFRSNRYNMVLVPFTGIDNHNRCVIFAAALLASESAKRYTWLLKSYCGKYGYHDARNCPEKEKSLGKSVYPALYKGTYAFDN
ncbi:FAR1 DNA binding domain, Zinc finger, SWIM-type, MULE transposase domain, FHY3/FAR1 family [Artemisia annua]|uniref:FAR1 DNA binding domain, Zinc finger, SWIM-type, MULE transposase domain, FHY3/FAR1 family n=1 Tax=Artemisia annua TaxID=35608 RepID=A0A2U1QAP7_ARTAN|nr:FAR1 DNA binding domain, Zinc finger, SWIM-type, MULE transposase domain, FHY3/FAR1 family [Artemisia annua]